MTRIARRDLLLATTAFAVTFAYCCLLPPVLMPGDEANYLHEAKRVARGEVLYRDVFELTTPGWVFFVATLFRLFGTTLATAEVATAAIHGLSAALVFLVCRVTGVRRAIAWPISLLHVTVAMPAWPMASQHWLAAMLSVALFLACAALPREPAWWRLVPGILLGLFISTHQRGTVIGVGVVAWLLVDRLLTDSRRAAHVTWLLAPVFWCALGSLVVVVPLTVYLLATSGADALWRALVLHPLLHYGGTRLATWGQAGFMSGFTFPTLLKYSPALLTVPVVRLGRALWLRTRRAAPAMPSVAAPPDEASQLVLALVLCAASIASIQYYPGIGHIGFITPVFLVVLGQSLEWGAASVPWSGKRVCLLGWVAVVALLVGTGSHLVRNFRAWQRLFPLRQETEFGRIAISSTVTADEYDYLRQLLDLTPGRSLFGYPASASNLCLIADARNPTRFEYFSLGYNTPDQVREVVATLVNDPPAYFILNGPVRPDDPIQVVLDHHFSTIFLARGMGQFTILEPRAGPSRPSGP